MATEGRGQGLGAQELGYLKRKVMKTFTSLNQAQTDLDNVSVIFILLDGQSSAGNVGKV